MIFLLFLIFVNAEVDCYFTHKDQMLNPCVKIADLNNDNILNAVEIDQFCALHDMVQHGCSSSSLFEHFNVTNQLTMDDWNNWNDYSGWLNLCFICQYHLKITI